MQQIIESVTDFTIIKLDDEKWIKVTTQAGIKNKTIGILGGSQYLEIPNDTLVEVLATPLETAKYFLIFNK
jgi:hypothetical protein